MSREVRKYAVGYGEAQTYMPATAKILYVGTQANDAQGREGVFAWALVKLDDVQPVARQVGYFATGEAIPDGAEYIGTAKTPDGVFVWHVFAAASEIVK